MVDRLLSLTLTLTLATGAMVKASCCCQLGDAAHCQLDAGSKTPACCIPASSVVDGSLPPCCRAKQAADEPAGPGECGCDGCLSNRPASPFAETAPAPRAPNLDDLPPALGAGPQEPVLVAPLSGIGDVPLANLSLDRPPPDRQALLCVWVI